VYCGALSALILLVWHHSCQNPTRRPVGSLAKFDKFEGNCTVAIAFATVLALFTYWTGCIQSTVVSVFVSTFCVKCDYTVNFRCYLKLCRHCRPSSSIWSQRSSLVIRSTIRWQCLAMSDRNGCNSCSSDSKHFLVSALTVCFPLLFILNLLMARQ